MPLVRVDLSRDASPEMVSGISDAIYEAMITVANVPVHDKFQVFSRHAANEIIYPKEGYLGVSYTPEIVLIQVTWNAGRSIEVKKAFYLAVANGIHERTGLRKEDICINLVDVNREDWSYGNGEMHYALK